MARSPRFKVYDANGVYQAACKEPEAAAAVVSLYGPGATIRTGHTRRNTVWVEGEDGDGEAGASYDAVADRVLGGAA